MGTVNVNGTAILNVNISLRLGLPAAAAGRGHPCVLNLNGGTAAVLPSWLIAGGQGSAVNINGGTLIVTNTAARESPVPMTSKLDRRHRRRDG
jgi:hypothetical protein